MYVQYWWKLIVVLRCTVRSAWYGRERVPGSFNLGSYSGRPFVCPAQAYRDRDHGGYHCRHREESVRSEGKSPLYITDIQLTEKSPYLTSLLCASQHAPSFPSRWARLLRRPSTWPKLTKELAAKSLYNKALLGTTQAVDVIRGGVKVNALPELVTAQVNFRIDFSESIESTKKHVEKVVRQVAKHHGHEFTAFGKSNTTQGISLDVFGIPIEPAPLTPATGGAWEMFAGTVR